jgi:flagellar biosynthesis protein FlhA
MPEATRETTKRASSGNDWVVPVIGVAMVFVMMVPIPALILDLLLATSITCSVLVMLVSMYIQRPVQFSVFPSLLLMLTLFRLSLNLASSRRILLHGSEGPSAAGHVIEAFGQFVVGGNYVVGFVLFLALVAIQFLVINHGAVRIAEVTARFTLDALPGKQMAIDADLNAGNIDEAQARKRRRDITQESEFYGAMDGAARFSQRDSMATILVTVINIGAGFLIGVFFHNMQIQEALKTYTILTVGDGLVTMIPSLLVSVAGGMVATRASSESSLGIDLSAQLLPRKNPLYIAAGVMATLGIIPGLPKLSFFLMAGLTWWLARRAARMPEPEEGKGGSAVTSGKTKPADNVTMLPKLDDLSMEVGFGLVPLVDEGQGGQMLGRIRALRKHLAAQLGFVIPSVHITDNAQLKPREYVIRLRGVEIAKWETYQNFLLAISADTQAPPLDGKETREPAFGVAARWISPDQREKALAAGYAVVDQTSAIATHLAEVIKQHAHALLTRQEVKRLLDSLSETQPKLVEELVPKALSLGEVQRVLQQLLREQVPIRDLPTILETLLDVAALNKQTIALVEAVRQALGRALVQNLVGEDGKLTVVTVDPGLEEQIYQVFEPQNAANRNSVPPPAFLRRVLDALRALMNDQLTTACPTLLCSSPARFHLRRLLEPFIPKLAVVSPAEIPPTISIQSMGVVR